MDGRNDNGKPQPKTGYPDRPKSFIAKFIRVLVSSGGMRDLSPEAVKLVLAIAAAEDDYHYSRPVRFWNDQLYDKLGFRSPKTLNNARHEAVTAGWLAYSRAGNRSDGEYFVMVPKWAEQWLGRSIEDSQALVDSFRTWNESGLESGSNQGRIRDESRNESRNESGLISNPVSVPGTDPVPKREPAGKPATLAHQELLMFLVSQWNTRKLGPHVKEDPLPSYVTKAWQKAQKDSELREFFRDQAAIEALLTAIPENTWAIKQNWWGFHSLFEKDMNKSQWKAAKLLARQYRNADTRQPAATTKGLRFEEGSSDASSW